MQSNIVTVSPGVTIGGGRKPFALIAGPCVIESRDLCREIAAAVKEACAPLGIPYIFKASYDKANRTSATSFRGQGMHDGLEILAQIREEFGVPVLTDVHDAAQCAAVAEAVDVLQIPAFLSRQTDLLVAAGETGKTVNIKKGQFLAPWDMKNAVLKVTQTGNNKVLVCERGVSFGYNNLVVDFRALPQMREATNCPVVMDATHAVQQPGGLGNTSGGTREYVPTPRPRRRRRRHGRLFVEVHPNPEKALSDAATMLRLSDLPTLLQTLVTIDSLVR
jgi:2-dehydro-3-deoxyphosphooctonate aldolase (KDO 8-P synthase)